MREIIFDTETTGLDPLSGDRLVEIGCVEVENYLPTGRTYHQYINPERDMPEGAFRIHGLSAEFLGTKPVFAEIYGDFLDFVGEARLVAHNAEFDMKFINHELARVGNAVYPMSRAIDTLDLARQKFPGANNTLDALCKRFDVDNTARIKHGALLDAELLAEVYLELKGGRQRGLALDMGPVNGTAQNSVKYNDRTFHKARPHQAGEAELSRHREFVATVLGDKSLWIQDK